MIEQTRHAAKGSRPLSVDDAGWLRGVRRVVSPNFDVRPRADDIGLLVIHAISLPPGRFGGPAIDQLFTNTLDGDAHPYYAGLRGLRVSAHLLVRRGGGLTQYVSFAQRAWHAGVSSFEGRTGCNDFSIGIELEGSDAHPFTNMQYRRLVAVTRALLRRYDGLSPARIVGHSDIAPGRKTDPGPHFDWPRYRAALHGRADA